MMFGPALRKFTFATHVTSSIDWLGAVLAFLALAVIELSSENASPGQATEPARTATGRLPSFRFRYLHSGQQPVDATFVAAAAAVPNIATRAAARPISFIFIAISIE